MTIASAHARPDAAALARRAGAALQRAAGVLLLCVVVGRAFVAEFPFRTPLLDLQPAPAAQHDAAGPMRSDRGELARMSFACLLLGDATLWLIGAALAGRLVMRHAKLAALMGLFALLSATSIFVAADKRSALDEWAEQLAMMVGCFLAAQCLGDRRGLRLTAAALAGLGAVLALKGVHQVLVEIPQTAAYLAAYGRPGGLAGTAAERAFAARVRATTPTGFWGLSNPLASLLIVCLLAAVGLAADKCRRAVRDWRSWRQSRAKGVADAPKLWRRSEVHAPTLAAAVTGVLAVAGALGLILTRSRGGILAGGLVLVAWAAVSRWRAALSAQWRKAVAAVLVLFLIGCACVVGYGLATDRLPSKTMTFRWHYWTATAAMARDHPLLGVGPGNFPSAYLRYRRLGAEEAVKLPHNVVAEAVSQYGIPGGAVYLAVVLVVLVGMCRPVTSDVPSLGPPSRSSRVWLAAGAVAITAVVSRWLFSEAGGYASLLLLDGIVPAALLVAAVLAAAWTGRATSTDEAASSSGLRVALACGAAGVFLHGMVELSLFMAGAATAFWVVAGACLPATARPQAVPGGASGGRSRDISPLRWVLAGNVLVVAVAAVAVFWWPVYRRTTLTEAALRAWVRQDAVAMANLAERAGRSDPLDGYAAADAARAVLARAGGDWASAQDSLTVARGWAGEALRRDRAYYGHFSLAAEIAWLLAARDNYAYCWDRLAPPPEGGQGPAAEDPVGLAAAAKRAYGDRRYGEAVALLSKAVEADTESASLHGYLGDAAWMAGQTDQAQAAWRRAATLAPRGPAVDDALACMARAVELNPMDHRLRLAAARMSIQAGRPAEGVRELDAAERVNAALDAESLMRFDADEQAQIRLLRARAGAVAAAGGSAG